MASFVSARDISAAKALKKQEKKSSRDDILKQAKSNHERRKRRKELREQRGEDKWMAPDLMSRFSDDTTSHTRKKHKKIKKKKHSKHTERINVSSSDSSCGESVGDVWVEKGRDSDGELDPVSKTSEPDNLQRDSWMTAPMQPSHKSLFVIENRRKSQVEEKKSDSGVKVTVDNPGQHPRELNPYWKDGGTGLPEKRQDKQSSSRLPGDGGRSWMLRAYKRALEQAESEGRELEEIAIARWGSLDKLHLLLRAAGIDPNNPDKAVSTRKHEYLYAEPPQTRKHLLSKKSRHASSDPSDRIHTSESQNPSRLKGFLIPGENKPDHASHVVESKDSYKSTNWYKKNTPQREKYDDRHAQLPMLNQGAQVEPSSLKTTLTAERTDQDTIDREPKVTDAELNALSAKVMKAEMLGDLAKVETLKKKLERLHELKERQQNLKSSPKKQDECESQARAIPLVSTDRFGRVRPLDMPSSERIQRHSAPPAKKSKRKKYTNDGESYSIRELMEQERKMSTRDTQLAIAGMASKFVSSSDKDDTVDEKHASKVAVSYDPRQNDGKEFMRAMTESKKLAETMDNCKLCFGNDNFSKSLLVAVGISVYLAVPATQSLINGHCLLIPMEHHTSMIQLDENVWDEIEVFRKGLTRMFNGHGCDIVFTESYMNASKRTHAYLECIPLPREQGDLAPMYFKKAIMESDEEWSINRKLIDTKQKGVRSSLPIGLPYFFVEFGLDGGFAHIIEDQGRFPSYFAKEVIGGMMDLEPRLWLKPPLDSFEIQKSKVLKLSDWWRPFDWTQKLKKN